MAQQKRWTVSAALNAPLNEVARKLTEAGFVVDGVLTEIGCITGSADTAVAKRVRSIPGVTDVSEELAFDIGPPDNDVM